MRALTSPSARSDVFMFFGIDCTHVTCSRERPSIAAIIGSKDSTSSSSSFFFILLQSSPFLQVLNTLVVSFNSSLRRAKSPWKSSKIFTSTSANCSKNSRLAILACRTNWSSIERVLMTDRFKRFSTTNSARFNKPVEVREDRERISKDASLIVSLELYGHNPLPQICFVIVKRRHNTRFFVWDKQTNQTNNVQPGSSREIVSLDRIESNASL